MMQGMPRFAEREAAQKRVEALMKELQAAQDDAVRARLRGASLFEDNINQKKENQELKKKHEGALADAHNLRRTRTICGRASTCSSASRASSRRRSCSSKALRCRRDTRRLRKSPWARSQRPGQCRALSR